MDNTRYKELLSKLNIMLHHGDGCQNPSVSPTLVPGVDFGPPGTLYSGMNMEALSKNELCLVHTNLHRFYPSGIGKVTKIDIEQLHAEIKERIKHTNFDMLDKNDKQNRKSVE